MSKNIVISQKDSLVALAVLKALQGDAGTALDNAMRQAAEGRTALMANLYAVAQSALGVGLKNEDGTDRPLNTLADADAYFAAVMADAESAFRESAKAADGTVPTLGDALGARYAYWRSVKSRTRSILNAGFAMLPTLAAAEKARNEKANTDRKAALGNKGKKADAPTAEAGNPGGGAVKVGDKWGPMVNALLASLNALPHAFHDDAAKEIATLTAYWTECAATVKPDPIIEEDAPKAANG